MSARSRSVTRRPVTRRSASSEPTSPTRREDPALDEESQVASHPVRTLQDAQFAILALQQVDMFHGKPSYPPSYFLREMRTAFSLMGPRSDSEKVDLTVSRLRGKARDWVDPYLNRDPPPAWLSDFDRFADELTRRFKAPSRTYDVSASLQSLKQTGSVADYATEFQQLAAPLGWDDAPLIDYFYRGLKHAVKKGLVGLPKATSLESLIQLSTDIDNHLQGQDLEEPRPPRPSQQKKFQPRGQAAPSTPSRGPVPAPTRDSGPRQQARTTAQPGPRQLSDEEKILRRKYNLCMYCGSPKHAVPDCPLCPSNKQTAARASGVVAAAAPNPQGNALAQQQ